jgi:hypothetical protein
MVFSEPILLVCKLPLKVSTIRPLMEYASKAWSEKWWPNIVEKVKKHSLSKSFHSPTCHTLSDYSSFGF